MRWPDSIQVLLRVRSQREEVEERKLAEIIRKLEIGRAELAGLSTELEHLTTTRVSEIQLILPNAHHQATEAHSRTLWRRRADQAAEIELLKEAHARQMSVYLSARRDREVMESLNKRSNDALEAATKLREQRMNEELFLARRVAKQST